MSTSNKPLRWALADEPSAQEALFDERDGRWADGVGEFRGMAFLHVRAKRIINEMKRDPRLGFRFTINAYRGCSHACTYCLEGATRVLMADGRTRPIADLRAGDLVYGTTQRGRYRRFVPTPVLDQWSTVKPAYRVTLADGTELIASGDHRLLTDRGWKYVVGAEQGSARRPHLTPNNRLLGTGAFALAPSVNGEYQRGYLCGMIRGDGHLGHYNYPRPGRSRGELHRFRLALADREALLRTQTYLSDLDVETSEFGFQVASQTRRTMTAIRTQARRSVAVIEEQVRWPQSATLDWVKGFLAGIFDAEGSYSGGVLRIANSEPELIAQINAALHEFAFRPVIERTARGMMYVRVLGGLPEHLRFFHTVDPAITRKRDISGRAVKIATRLDVVAVKPTGFDIPLFDITTSTGDFVANGVINHNCFARPSHAWLDLDTGRDFERRIVVKINAVERLRAELAPRRWAGDHIAMGTNTDPYQRCEGKYRLTRGIVEVLTEAANPFSILTKSTLVLRDLDLLAEAARRTEVRVNLSIGTLDEDVWRLTEPGTPHPRQRARAVERLNAAGVPCGVLVAPVLPGLSDRPAQLEAVARASAEAGAVSVSTVLLHLRPGVKEPFLASLAVTHPHLVERYARLYPRANAPKADQRRAAAIVSDAVLRAGGLSAPPRAARRLTGQPVSVRRRREPLAGPGAQLGLW